MNAVNRDYQEMLTERARVHSELEQRRAEIRRLAAGVGPFADTVRRQMEQFDFSRGDCFVAPADREPPTSVGLFDGTPNPQDPRSRYAAACDSVTRDEE
jgi:hypothetical protein